MAAGRNLATMVTLVLGAALGAMSLAVPASAAGPATVHWRNIPLDRSTEGGQLVPSCATAAFCVATDYFGNVSYYDGTRWSAAHRIDDLEIVSLSCASAKLCTAGDKQGRLLSFNGSQWTEPEKVFTGRAAAAVSCASHKLCVAVSEGATSTFDGSLWSAPVNLPGGSSGNQASIVSCAGIECLATSADPDGPNDLYTFDGHNWSSATAFGGIELVSCAAPDFCAIASRNRVTTLHGTTVTHNYTVSNVLESDSVSLDCASETFCLYLGWASKNGDDVFGQLFSFDGSSWTNVPSWSRGQTDAVIDCVSTAFCDIGETSTTVTWNGDKVTRRWRVLPYTQVDASSCSTTTFCVGTDSVGAATLMRGHTWQNARVLSERGLSEPSYVACVRGVKFCAFAAGKAVRFYQGGKWHGNHDVDSAALSGVACGSPNLCAAIDTDGRVVTWNGSKWSPPHRLVGSGLSLYSLACGGSTTCVVADSDGGIFADHHGWSSRHIEFPTPSTTNLAQTSVSCASGTRCFAAGAGRIGSFDGRHWTKPVVLKRRDGSDASVGPVLCASRHGCVAFGDANTPWATFAAAGSHWVQQPRHRGVAEFVDCAPKLTCLEMPFD